MTASARPLPMTAAALLAGNQILTHTSVRGDVPPRLHPVLREFVDNLPVEQRERFAGWCAEAILVSDRLYAADDANGAMVSAAQARQAVWGSRLRVTRIRELGDPTHGQVQAPCRSCAAMLEFFGVEEVS
ncbi:MAG TPA: YwqJ-related putative deaminase [Cryptosporangiaceae bacterium]|nr:YwqJ-related putative deaminase [Cryptosporangiaceae bacterium]